MKVLSYNAVEKHSKILINKPHLIYGNARGRNQLALSGDP
jgi:hypothetical protein